MLRVHLGAVCCALFVWLGVISASTPARAQDEASETQRLERECRGGRGPVEACSDYGHRLYSGIGVAADHPAALRVFRAACERGSAQACSNVGVVLRWSDVVAHDLPRALEYFDKACSMSFAAACMQVGHMRRDGIGGAVDVELARQGYSLACANRNGEGCRLQGRIYADGMGNVPKHEGNAVTAFRAGCGLGDMESCALVGYMAGNGRGMALDADLAVRQYQQACAGGVAFACGNLEIIRNAGFGSPGYAELMSREAAARAFPSDLPAEQRFILASAALQGGDTALAIAGYQALAESGMADAAYALGQIYYEGQGGVARDVRKAVAYFRQASEAHHPYAQFVMAQFYRSGFIVEHNEIWSIQLMRAADEAGGIAEAGPIWRAWQAEMNDRYDARDAANRQMAIDNANSQAAADAANMARIWGLYASRQNQQSEGQVCGMIYRNNQANQECMARETFDRYYNPAYQ